MAVYNHNIKSYSQLISKTFGNLISYIQLVDAVRNSIKKLERLFTDKSSAFFSVKNVTQNNDT